MSNQVSQSLDQGATQIPASFSTLPLKIQMRIFEYALPGPRIITIDVKFSQMEASEFGEDLLLELDLYQEAWEKKREDKHFREKLGLHRPRDHHMILEVERAIAIQTIPALLHTCALSREVALKHYQFLSRGEKLSICIDFDFDTLQFQSDHAWKFFTQKPGELIGRYTRTTMIALNSQWGYEDGDRYSLNYNRFLNEIFEIKSCRERDHINVDTAFIGEMAQKLKFLALGVPPNCHPEWLMSFTKFWKLKKLWWRSWNDSPDTTATEDDLILEWRRLAAGFINKEEWLARKEEFTHITIPKIQRISVKDLQTKQRLDEGFDME
ncbi:hypothetical protein BOTCAL_0330g00080 [Botryotinia calthae]|uniref:2EXR domain-containing protein n=1 Tax=Botryotinia calthae TaxID=38488 RepID=A0A4Y8CTX3_9HELO|nr:hypothetical protein BOTCAL_0330g00080 [Botryotinia calthae]